MLPGAKGVRSRDKISDKYRGIDDICYIPMSGVEFYKRKEENTALVSFLNAI